MRSLESRRVLRPRRLQSHSASVRSTATIWATDINHPGSDNLCCRTARTPTIEEGLVSLSFHQSQAIATILGATATAIPNAIACQIVIYDSPSCLPFLLLAP